MARNIYLGNATIIIAKFRILKDGILAAKKKNDFLNLEIEGDSKVVIFIIKKK